MYIHNLKSTARARLHHLVSRLALASLTSAILLAPAHAEQISSYEISVLEAHTIRYNGETVRLEGYDAPEAISPDCQREEELGLQATDFLRRLLAEHFWVDLTMSGARDRSNQALGALKIDGRNVADLMIEAGLARAYEGGPRGSWCN
jgi:endonuclease YncB( thermonuclease family)